MNYSEIVISGTYGFTTIALTVFSIISTYIRSNVFPIQIVNLKRYSLILIFLPIIIHTFYLWIIFYNQLYGEFAFSILESSILIIYIFVHSSFILEIYYNPDNFKSIIKSKRTHGFMKKIKSLSEEDILKELKKEKEEFDKYFNERRSGNDNYIYNQMDAKEYFFELIKKIIEKIIDEENILKCMEIVKEYLDIDEKTIDNFTISDITKIKYLLRYSLKEKNNIEVYQSIFNRLYSLYENNKKGETSEEVYSLECYSELFTQLQLLTWCDSIRIKYLLDTLFDNKWNIEDSVYLSIFYKYIINIHNYIKIDVDSETKNKINYIINAYEDTSLLKDNQYGKEINELIKLIINYLKKGA